MGRRIKTNRTAVSLFFFAAIVLIGLASCSSSLLEIINQKAMEDTAKEFISFAINSAENPSVSSDAVGTIEGSEITVLAPLGTDRSSLIAVFDSLCSSIFVGDAEQISGVTPNDFTVPVLYTLTAADGNGADYTVTVTINTEGVGIWDQSNWDECLWGE
jgi:hypothetical protein